MSDPLLTYSWATAVLLTMTRCDDVGMLTLHVAHMVRYHC